jgi:hypothetical protein
MRGSDTRSPHDQDEIRSIRSGSDVFIRIGEREPYGSGDRSFDEAGIGHRLVDVTEDFEIQLVRLSRSLRRRTGLSVSRNDARHSRSRGPSR